MGVYVKVFLTVFIFFFILFLCFAGIDEARYAYSIGNTDEALLLYKDWLSDNRDSDNFTSVLFEISELSGNIDKITLLLEKQINFVSERDDRKNLYERLAQFYELSANLNKAQIYYQKAALINLDLIDYRMLLESAKILLLEGELLSAEAQLEEILVKSSNTSLTDQGKLFFTILKILNSEDDIDFSLSPLEKPESIYLMYIIAKTNSKTVIMDKLIEKIVNNFEKSPEAGLIRNELSQLPDIITSFALLNNGGLKKIIHNYMIQTGSFKDSENAHYLSIDLKKRGFNPIVEEQIIHTIKYYKVLLYFSSREEISNALIRLKEEGFEGFPVY